MSGAPGNTSRSVHRTVRDLVSLFLDSQGIGSIPKRDPRTLSDAFGDDALDPDLSLPDFGVDLRVSSKLRPFRLSEDLESAQRVAAIRGTSIGAVVQWRERPIDEAFVILDLQDFARLLRGDHRKPPL